MNTTLKAWADAKMDQQRVAIKAARMPDSLEDAKTPEEFLKFTQSLPEDSPLFTIKPESP